MTPPPALPAGRSGQNVELKARLADYDAALAIARRVADVDAGVLHQVDTYFHCGDGRLKLREIDGAAAELIWYRRPDEASARDSHYVIAAVSDPANVKAALAGALGVRGVVEKRRALLLHGPVRIHLDRVVGLGDFLEFEAVLSDTVDAAAGHALVERLRQEFGIEESCLLRGSYGELLAAE